jgi:HK97 family phage prohead protease
MLETAPFTLDLGLDSKAVEDDGDIYFEGWASDFEIDRQDEAFEPGAFKKSIERFLGTNPVLLYHHDYGKALGVVEQLDLRDEGLWMRARIDRPTAGSWAEDVVHKIKKGTIKGLSVGGLFKRRKGADGKPRIFEADLAEISVTPLPVNPRTIGAVAAKAFESDAATDGEQLVIEWFERQMAETRSAFDAVERRIEGV